MVSRWQEQDECWKESKSRCFKSSRAVRPRPLSYNSCHSHQNKSKLLLLQIKRKSRILYNEKKILIRFYKTKWQITTPFIFMQGWFSVLCRPNLIFFVYKLKTNKLLSCLHIHTLQYDDHCHIGVSTHSDKHYGTQFCDCMLLSLIVMKL